MEEIKIEKAMRDSWNTVIPLSTKITHLNLNRDFTEEEFAKISIGFIPNAMEDKWFIFLEDNILYFHRSWTGDCIYQVEFIREESRYIPIDVLVCRDRKKYKFTTKGYDERLLLFLIETLLLDENIHLPTLTILVNTIYILLRYGFFKGAL